MQLNFTTTTVIINYSGVRALLMMWKSLSIVKRRIKVCSVVPKVLILSGCYLQHLQCKLNFGKNFGHDKASSVIPYADNWFPLFFLKLTVAWGNPEGKSRPLVHWTCPGPHITNSYHFAWKWQNLIFYTSEFHVLQDVFHYDSSSPSARWAAFPTSKSLISLHTCACVCNVCMLVYRFLFVWKFPFCELIMLFWQTATFSLNVCFRI